MAEATWLVLLIVLPAAFNPFGQLAFEPVKVSLLRVAVVIIAVAWLAGRLLHSPRIDVGAHPVVQSGIALIAFTALSTLFSLEPLLSFFGAFSRAMGWLTVAAGGVLLIVSADMLVDERRRQRAITALLLGAIVPCGYLFVQRAGLDPMTWTNRGAPGSSLASPTFLGSYLVFVAPLALYRVIARAREGATLAYAGWLALFLVICTAAYLTTIRAPILGLAAGLGTFALLARPRRRPGRMEVAGAVAALLAALGVAVAAGGASGTLGLQRFLNIGQGVDSSVERVTVWRDAVRLPLSDPWRALIGFGLETQSVVLERAEATVTMSPAEQWDRAHNLVLDTWLTGGIVGIVALAVVLVCAIRGAWQARAAAPGLLPAALIAALVGHLVETTFAFHTVVTETLFWFGLGLAASLTPRVLPVLRPTRPRLLIPAVLSAVVLLPLMAAPAIADGLYGSARRTANEVRARREELAAAWAPWVEELPRAAALEWRGVANRRGDAAARARAEQDLIEAASRAPLEPLPQVRLTRWYLNAGNLEAAESACQRALATGPFRYAGWAACADVSTRRGLADESTARRARAEQLGMPH